MTHRGSRILPSDDPDCAQIVYEQMCKDGINFRHTTEIQSLSQIDAENPQKAKVAFKNTLSGHVDEEEFDIVLFATGREPNVEGLDCEKAGVKVGRNGIVVDNRLQTTNSSIYSCGDCIPGPNDTAPQRFTHASDVEARVVVRNALFFGKEKHDEIVLPAGTYTTPEIATVGMSEQQLK